VLDLYAHWDFAPGLQLQAGVRNIADRKYWASGDLPVAMSANGALDRFTSPGRSVAISLSVDL